MRIKSWRSILLMPLLLIAGSGNAGEPAIRDLRELRQDPTVYVDAATADQPLLPAEEQRNWNAASDILHFLPWHMTNPRHTLEQVSWGFKEYRSKPGYGRDGRPHPRDWLRKMARNAHIDDYPQGGFPAVTVKRIDFRVLPTRERHLDSPRPPGKEHPFDNLQESSAPPGTPVLVTHRSRDGKWLLTETSYALGWVPAADVAAVDAAFTQRWESGSYAVIVGDKMPVRDEAGTIRFQASLGAVFPKVGEDAGHIWILTAARDGQGKARLRKGWVPKRAAADKPLPLTPRAAATVAAEMIGEPYGWGGLDAKRDCSALIRDLFAPFGLWLPRNSREQAEAGRFISLRGRSPEEKEALIIGRGVPWRTLLWMPGHIMLYIGVHQGRPLVFHSFWSVRKKDAAGNRVRVIVGRAAVTTLQPGREFSGRDLPRADVEGMTLLGEPPEPGTSLVTAP
ncbi:MAG: NlpC/P60 family N-terminal domain-containing protein [Syntrophales bacterium]